MKVIFFLTILQFTLGDTQKDLRIIGGDVAPAERFTFSAAIYIQIENGLFFCGGALYTLQWIITAGQCVVRATNFTIYLGTKNINNLDPTALKFETDEYVLHPSFSSATLENDIALINLGAPVTTSEYLQPLTSLAYTNAQPNARYQAIGWGETSDESNHLSDELKVVELKVISNDECQETYGGQILDGMLCAVGSGNEGICKGDVGSPLVEYAKGVYAFSTHIAIASFISQNGCNSTDPSGFTRTYPYVDWIKNVTGNNL